MLQSVEGYNKDAKKKLRAVKEEEKEKLEKKEMEEVECRD